LGRTGENGQDDILGWRGGKNAFLPRSGDFRRLWGASGKGGDLGGLDYYSWAVGLFACHLWGDKGFSVVKVADQARLGGMPWRGSTWNCYFKTLKKLTKRE